MMKRNFDRMSFELVHLHSFFYELLEPQFLVIFWHEEIWIGIGTPGEAVAVHAQGFTLPCFLPTAPGLYEVVLFRVHATAVEAFWKVVISLPSSGPFVHGHDFHAMAHRRIDLHGITCTRP